MTAVRSGHAVPSTRRTNAGPRRRGLRAGWVLGAIYAGALAVLALWWHGTDSVVGAAGWLTDGARITGLLAAYGCAVLLALMARVPALESGVGTDRLARWHAAGGRYTVCLAAAHIVLVIWGYALTDRKNVIAQTGDLVFHYPEMLKATLGTLLMFAVGITSARVARRRLRYEVWHLLHLGTYLSIFLVFFHQLANGAQFVDQPVARYFWYTLFIGVSLVLAWYRFAVPTTRNLRHRMRVSEVRFESPGVVSVYITGHRLDDLAARPGQFFRWRFLAPGMWWAANPYSLSAPARDGQLRITVKAAGDHSRGLVRLRPGTRVWAEGPYGAFTDTKQTRRRVLLLAGGVGITPLRALFETLRGDVTLIYLARRPEDLALRDELEAIAARRDRRVLCFVDDPAEYSLPLTGDSLRSVVPDVAERDVYLCGPPGMAHAAHRALREAGVPSRHVHHESFEF
ncbi:ferredoxin reductase family protein [Actinomadura harenae]|uniref:Ferric reductase n=1 Tax=Actinomadura harenae TaxID=2483351 RepID=A0A3M2M217_9ACTN|nr:ferric reductase-like transmembrane domain-containing protein [Actinomadura harenae]RMI43667.1 ferric reductase [Actinomadura harenae]